MKSTSDEKRIRVALVITELNVGGAERCLTQLAIGLDRARFDPLVIVIAPRPLPEQQSLLKRLEAADVPVRFLNASSKWLVLIAARRLRKTLIAFEPDVVQSFLFHADVLVRIIRRGTRHKACLGFRVADPSRRRQRLERWAAQPATAVVCVSEAVRDYARDEVRIAPEKLVVIPNSIDVDKQCDAVPFDLMALGLPASRRAILCVGRLHPQKGLDWLLAAMPAVFERLSTHDLLVVGGGPDATQLQAQTRQLGIAERVHFLGWRGDVPRLMAAASLLVLPSRWEGMPNVVLEAMATGLPVVATDTHGVRELLAPNDVEQTVQFGDTTALVEKLVAFGLDSPLAKRVGIANQQRAASRFSTDSMVNAYETLYESRIS